MKQIVWRVIAMIVVTLIFLVFVSLVYEFNHLLAYALIIGYGFMIRYYYKKGRQQEK